MELDKFDRLIVESLHHNARLSGAELARRVNLSARRWPSACLKLGAPG